MMKRSIRKIETDKKIISVSGEVFINKNNRMQMAQLNLCSIYLRFYV